MPESREIDRWVNRIKTRYLNYLHTSFYFKDNKLRKSFEQALNEENLVGGVIPEEAYNFTMASRPRELAKELFEGEAASLLPALLDKNLYTHQEEAIRAIHQREENIFVATGTASGKTEGFLYPILFELYKQHREGRLSQPGVRALILYPMNALANDQRERIGSICKALRDSGSDFKPTFGQYIGQTPYRESSRGGREAQDNRYPGEKVLRKEMRADPPHILMTNYSMLEYLLIRPYDSPLFDNGAEWKFIVLDEAHQYRGARGMEIGMLLRRLKQRLREGGRKYPFRCIATSATISSGESRKDKEAVAEFAEELFGEEFAPSGVIFGKREPASEGDEPRRFHTFLRALEGAFLIHKDGEDTVALNRESLSESEEDEMMPLEIALCKECGQHYYVGNEKGGYLREAVRDPSHEDFGVEYYLPLKEGDNEISHWLCRLCGYISKSRCQKHEREGAAMPVWKCPENKQNPDQLKKCAICEYDRGGIGDPVQEIVHGADGPNAVLATTLHELLPEGEKRVLAFADSRQEAAFFAWYAEDSYLAIRDRNLILRALRAHFKKAPSVPLSIEDLRRVLAKSISEMELFPRGGTEKTQNAQVLELIFKEAITAEKRLSLEGVGLVRWYPEIPEAILKALHSQCAQPPWNLTNGETQMLLECLLDQMRARNAIDFLQTHDDAPSWSDVCPDYPQIAYSRTRPAGQKDVREWGGPQSSIVKQLLIPMISGSGDDAKEKAKKLMENVWDAIRAFDKSATREEEKILLPGKVNGTFRLNARWLRIKMTDVAEIWECKVCGSLSTHNVRNLCLRTGCPGALRPINLDDSPSTSQAQKHHLDNNHYRILYKNIRLPPYFHSMEHTAQIGDRAARERQDDFKAGKINLLSSSTTFELGVDLGALEVVFLRNVPPEPFNYTQRAGRAGRRDKPGLVLTYCRRNPHDLYHFADQRRIIKGQIRPPQMQMTNPKIILRHMAAVALSAFFRREGGEERFKNVAGFVQDMNVPIAASDLRKFCKKNQELRETLSEIVPERMHRHPEIGLGSDEWVDKISGKASRLASAESAISEDHKQLSNLAQKKAQEGEQGVDRINGRIRTVKDEETLNFLSRKAIIPKYGFPVDVVELDTQPRKKKRSQKKKGDRDADISLQRDLSQAIAEYAPGSKVVANKQEWESYGVRVIPGKEFLVKHYDYDPATRNFTQWNDGDPEGSKHPRYLEPSFGFVTFIDQKLKKPRGRTRRLYTTRPFFANFERASSARPEEETICGVSITKAVPGKLVVLCEGKKKGSFHICETCGYHSTGRKQDHKTPYGAECTGSTARFALGYELVTDVVRMQFPALMDEKDAYSLAYAVLLGAAVALEIPDTDLNVTLTGGAKPREIAIVLYDNVPGGAGLVAQLVNAETFRTVLERASERVGGACGCDVSCYGCLRSYRNQFVHPDLNRTRAWDFIERALQS